MKTYQNIDYSMKRKSPCKCCGGIMYADQHIETLKNIWICSNCMEYVTRQTRKSQKQKELEQLVKEFNI